MSKIVLLALNLGEERVIEEEIFIKKVHKNSPSIFVDDSGNSKNIILPFMIN